MTEREAELIILVPGVGLGGTELCFLSRWLRRLGYRTLTFRHCPWCGELGTKAAQLRELISLQTGVDVVHFVGHSLGGQIILQMLAAPLPAHIGRTVTLGTPHMGSAAARRIGRVPLFRMLLGRALTQACASGPLPLPPDCQLGTIAGKLNLFLGWFLGVARPNDTIVAEAEAKHPDATDHLLLMVSHGSILVSPTVAVHVAHFLKHGTFRIASAAERPLA